MSMASKCDNCGSLFEREYECVTLDVAVSRKDEPDTLDNWSDVDFCVKCSKRVLDVIGKALNGLRRPK